MILYRGYKLKDWIMKAIKAVMRYESSILQFSNRDWERIKYISRSKIFLEYIYRENEKLIIIRSSTGKVNKINSSNYSQFVVTLPLLVISQSWIARNSANLGTGEVSLRIETRKSWTWRNDRVSSRDFRPTNTRFDMFNATDGAHSGSMQPWLHRINI